MLTSPNVSFDKTGYRPIPDFTELSKDLGLDEEAKTRFIRLQEIFVQFWNTPKTREAQAQLFRSIILDAKDARFDALSDLLTIAETYFRLPEGVRHKIQRYIAQVGDFPDYPTCLKERLVRQFIEAIEGRGVDFESALPCWGRFHNKVLRPYQTLSFGPMGDGVDSQTDLRKYFQDSQEILELEALHPGILKDLELLAKAHVSTDSSLSPVKVNGSWYV